MAELGSELEAARDSPVAVVREVVKQVREDDVPFMAGSIAYQAFASLVPLLVLLFIVMAVLGDQELAQRVVELTEGVLPDSAQELVRNAILSKDSAGGTASIIGLVTVIWGSLKIFRGLDKAFSEIYETEAENSLGDQVRDGIIVLAALGIGIVGMVGAMSVFAAFGRLSRVLSFFGLIVGLTLTFLPMYKLFPDADLEWAEALPGAVVAAVGWVGLQFLFQLYLQFSSRGDSSGVLGAVLLLLLWLYFSGLVLLLAAVVNAVLLGEGEAEATVDTDADEDPTPDGVPTRAAERIGTHREGPDWEPPTPVRARFEEGDAAGTDAEPGTEPAVEPGTADAVASAELRRRNRALERRVAWLQQPFHTRLASRLFGAGPPPVPERPAPEHPGDEGEPRHG